MFEPLPEKPPHFALHRVGFVALLGGIAGCAVAAFIFGEKGFQNDVVVFGSFLIGALVGGLAGWKLVTPPPQPPQE